MNLLDIHLPEAKTTVILTFTIFCDPLGAFDLKLNTWMSSNPNVTLQSNEMK